MLRCVYFEHMMRKDIPNEFYGLTRQQVLDVCKSTPFPGMKKWPADHPIWNCNVAGYMTPREAWKNEKMLMMAIDNLFWILNKSVNIGPVFYPEFAADIEKAFKEGGVALCRKVLTRFTVAKIAPKVTALRAATFEQIIEQSKIDISCGVYCPMAGFGGIIEGCKRWFEKRSLQPVYEAYDINPNFCKYYGWHQRDALAQTIETGKVVVACPPFGTKTERWEGTPDDMYYDFHDWCKLLKEHIIAPNYIFIGPETYDVVPTYKSGKQRAGLFRKKIGIQYYPEYST